jgi:hypothetical protein
MRLWRTSFCSPGTVAEEFFVSREGRCTILPFLFFSRQVQATT